VKSFYGVLKRKTIAGSTFVCRSQVGKVDIDQSAVTEMMVRVGAMDLYKEFMDAVFAVTGLSWRRQLLELRSAYAPRFFAFGIDVWVCKKHVGGVLDEFWMLFVDRSIAPHDFKQSISWRHLLWGMGAGLKQQEMAPIIQNYLQQLSATSTGDDLTKKTTEIHPVAPLLPLPETASPTAPPPYDAELQV